MPLNEMEEARIRFESELAITFSIFGVWVWRWLLDIGGVNWCELKEGRRTGLKMEISGVTRS